MKSNPEFIRNLWLELIPYHLIALFLVYGLLLILHLVVNDYAFNREIGHAAVFLLLIVTGIWGTKKASGAVYGEVAERTWDWQRISGLSPWSMTWGKLFGSTSFTWYGGFLCLIVAVLAYANGDARLKDWQLLGLSVFGVLLSHGLGFLISLFYIRSRTLENARGGGSIYLLVLLLFLFLSSFAGDLEHSKALLWYGQSLTAYNYLLVTAVLLWLWTLIGAYRVMRRELSYSGGPWVWIVFLWFLPLFFGGLAVDKYAMLMAGNGAKAWWLLAFGFWVAGVWLALFVEPKNPVDLRALLVALKTGQGRHVAQLMPAWLTALLLLPLAIAALYLMSSSQSLWEVKMIGLAQLATLAFLFLLRDISIFLLLALAKKSRADISAVIYLLVLYLLIPWILDAMGLDRLQVFFCPSPEQPLVWAMGGALTAAVIALVFLVRRWRRWSSAQASIA
ncbi:MAG: hypothetical protein P8179_08235 [Candidatus Thiodiazotropha sp.]